MFLVNDIAAASMSTVSFFSSGVCFFALLGPALALRKGHLYDFGQLLLIAHHGMDHWHGSEDREV